MSEFKHNYLVISKFIYFISNAIIAHEYSKSRCSFDHFALPNLVLGINKKFWSIYYDLYVTDKKNQL